MTFDAIDTSFPVFALALSLAVLAVLGVMALLVVLTARRGEPVPRLRLVPPLEAEKILSRTSERAASPAHPVDNREPEKARRSVLSKTGVLGSTPSTKERR